MTDPGEDLKALAHLRDRRVDDEVAVCGATGPTVLSVDDVDCPDCIDIWDGWCEIAAMDHEANS